MVSIRIARCSSPRPDTASVSGWSVSSTRIATFRSSSRYSRSRTWRVATNLPHPPAQGGAVTLTSTRMVGSFPPRLAIQPLAPLARSHEPARPPGKGRVVHHEVHRDGGLLHRDPCQPLQVLAVRHRLADLHPIQPPQRHDV